MIVHDPIYGRFELPDFLAPLLAAPEFRRLSEVRLININSPTLSALGEVRRYSHTLGVLHLAMQASLPSLGEDVFRALLASIIVHDAGTPAFAHLFEYALIDRYEWNHEAVLPAIMTRRHHPDGELHQIHSSGRPAFKRLCRRVGVDFDLVLDILGKRHAASKLIFGSVDFDNLDNVARMSGMLGQRFDVGLVLRLAAALDGGTTDALLLPEDRQEDLAAWAALRRSAYEVIVFDGPTVAGQAVLSKLIRDALESGALGEEDWTYTDRELVEALRNASPEANDLIHRDFLGALPDLRLIIHVGKPGHPLLDRPVRETATLVEDFLADRRVARPYGYCLRDRGTFEKRIEATDPRNGHRWTIGQRSDSVVVYGFGKRGLSNATPEQVGREFLSWYEEARC